jgi:hypothetical protein
LQNGNLFSARNLRFDEKTYKRDKKITFINFGIEIEWQGQKINQ